MCNCIKEIGTKIQERFNGHVADIPNGVVTKKASLSNVCLVFNRNQSSQLYAPVEGKYMVGKKPRKYSENILFTYCPFCGIEIS